MVYGLEAIRGAHRERDSRCGHGIDVRSHQAVDSTKLCPILDHIRP
jgi:hypothetical protein